MHDAERFATAVELRIVPSLCPLDNSPYDYSAARQLIDRAAVSTRQWLEAGGLDRAGTPMQLLPHTH